MNIILTGRTKIIATSIATVFVLGILLLEHFQGGVVAHHLFANKDMPKVSNWWGVLVIPLMTYLSLSLLQKRLTNSDNKQKAISKQEYSGFLGAVIFGIAITILFFSAPTLPGYLVLMTFALAFFKPLYRPEYFLGFILSMTYGFGGVLPVLFGLIFVIIYLIEYRLIRQGILLIWKKING